MLNAKKICQQVPMIPVMVIHDPENAVPLAQSLIDGGLTVLEITLRTECALTAIEKIAAACSNAIVGAGSLKTPADVTDCLNAGAVFGVSPGTPTPLIEKILDRKLPFLPGCATPTEAMTLSNYGFDVLKFFPAEAAGGPAMLQSMGAPLPHISFCPTGGISLNNAKQYLSLSNVVTIGGSWPAPDALIAEKNWTAISRLARETIERLGTQPEH